MRRPLFQSVLPLDRSGLAANLTAGVSPTAMNKPFRWNGPIKSNLVRNRRKMRGEEDQKGSIKRIGIDERRVFEARQIRASRQPKLGRDCLSPWFFSFFLPVSVNDWILDVIADHQQRAVDRIPLARHPDRG